MENLELEQQLEKAKTGSGADEEMRESRQQSGAGSGIDPVTGLPSEPGSKTRHKSDAKGGSGPGETFDGQKQPGAELGSTHVVKGHVSGAEDPLDYPERTDPVTGLPLGQQDEEYAGNDGSAQRPSQDASRVTGQAPAHQKSASKVASGTGETFDPNSEARKESGDTGASIGRGSKQSGNGGRVSGGPPFERDSESRKNSGYDPNSEIKRQSIQRSASKTGAEDSRYGETFDPNKEATQRGGSGTPGSRRESYFDKLAQKHRQSVNSGDGKTEGGMKSNMDGTKGKTCCGAGIHGGSGEGRSLNDKTIEQIKTELEASSRRNPVHVRCGSLHCDCAYHYLKEGKLYCIRTKKKSLNKETDIVSSKSEYSGFNAPSAREQSGINAPPSGRESGFNAPSAREQSGINAPPSGRGFGFEAPSAREQSGINAPPSGRESGFNVPSAREQSSGINAPPSGRESGFNAPSACEQSGINAPPSGRESGFEAPSGREQTTKDILTGTNAPSPAPQSSSRSGSPNTLSIPSSRRRRSHSSRRQPPIMYFEGTSRENTQESKRTPSARQPHKATSGSEKRKSSQENMRGYMSPLSRHQDGPQEQTSAFKSQYSEWNQQPHKSAAVSRKDNPAAQYGRVGTVNTKIAAWKNDTAHTPAGKLGDTVRLEKSVRGQPEMTLTRASDETPPLPGPLPGRKMHQRRHHHRK